MKQPPGAVTRMRTAHHISKGQRRSPEPPPLPRPRGLFPWTVILLLSAFLCGSWLLADEPAVPVVTGFSPASGPPGTRLSIRGSNLVDVTAVQIHGIEAEFGVLVVGTEVYAIVPTNATTGPITVVTSSGQAESPTDFMVTEAGPPWIADVVPAQGQVGTTVTITGSNFVSLTAVLFNGRPASFNSFDTETIITSVPPGATTGPITVSNAFGGVSTDQSFVVLAPQPPVISGFTPTDGPAGTAVLIQGTNLSQATSVQFNGAEATFISLGTDRLSASVPAAATSGPITVTTPLGSATTTIPFTVTLPPGPVIETFTPNQGRAGTPVLILGTNLNRTVAVKFNGVSATFTTYSSGILYTVVPNGALTGPLTVETMVGTDTTTESFTVIHAGQPVITGFEPASGLAGTVVSIQGSNLVNVMAVKFNGLSAPFSTAHGLEALVPEDAESGPITVITWDGQAVSTSSFTVIQPPQADLHTRQQGTLTWVGAEPAAAFTLSVTNAGPDTATRILLTNLFLSDTNSLTVSWPEAWLTNLTYQTVKPSQGLYNLDNGILTWQVGNLPAGREATLALLVTGMPEGQLHSWAVTSADQKDREPNNNTVLTSVTVEPLVPTSLAIARGPDLTALLSWPATSPRWRLQFNPLAVADDDSWTDSDQTPTLVEGRYQVVVDARTALSYFRLIWR